MRGETAQIAVFSSHGLAKLGFGNGVEHLEGVHGLLLPVGAKVGESAVHGGSLALDHQCPRGC